MKRFKIKNRQKRKYRRKTDISSYFSLPQEVWIGLLPSILIAIIIFAELLAQMQPADRIGRVSIDRLLPLESIASLPRLFANALLGFFASLDPTPIASSIITYVALLISTAERGVAYVIEVGSDTVFSVVHLLSILLSSILNTIVIAFNYLFNFLLWVLLWVGEALLSIGQLMINGVVGMIFAIIGFFTAIANTISNIVMYPFVVLGKQYEQLKPLLDFIGANIGQSLKMLTDNFSVLASLSSEAAASLR